MIVTKDFIQAGRSEKGGLTREQFRLLGIAWPPKPGWQHEIIGNEITFDDAVTFLEIGPEPGAFKLSVDATSPPRSTVIDRYDALKAQPDTIRREYPD